MNTSIRGSLLVALLVPSFLVLGCGSLPSPSPGNSSRKPIGALAKECRLGIQGAKGKIILAIGDTIDLPSELMLVSPGSIIDQHALSSRSRVIFPSGAIAEVKGIARYSLNPSGLEMFKGNFVGEFRRMESKGFVVRVPGIILGIRGTRLSFALEPGQGRIRLLEGRVEVRPDNPQMAPFELLPGQEVRYEGDSIVRQKNSPVAPPPRQGTAPKRMDSGSGGPADVSEDDTLGTAAISYSSDSESY